MKKIKILHILNTGSYSGAENVVISIIEHSNKYANSVYAGREGSIKEILETKGIDYYKLDHLDIKNIRKAIRKIHPDIIHAHDFTAGIITSFSTVSIPIISHLHNNSPWLKTLCLKSFIYGISCIKYKKILTVSDSIMKEYIFGKQLGKKTKRVGNPVDIYNICEKAEKAFYVDSYDIVFLGRLSFAKNPFYFLEIIKNCVQNFREAMEVTDFWHSLGNSLLITLVAVGLSIVVHSLMGYALGRNKAKNKSTRFAEYNKMSWIS